MSSRRPELSEKQAEVWAFVVEHVCRHGFQPTIREMAEHFGVTPKAILDRIAHLANKGYVETGAKASERCLRLKSVTFVAVHSDEPPEPRPAPVDRTAAGPAHRQAMADYLASAGNAWTATIVLAEAAGVDAFTARKVLADSPPGLFESTAQGVGNLWRLDLTASEPEE